MAPRSSSSSSSSSSRSLLLGLGLLLALLASLAHGFLAPARPASSALSKAPLHARRARAAPTSMSASPLLDAASSSLSLSAAAPTTATTTLVADYFSTVDEIARGIGDRPWLQYFIPTAVGMSISLAIVFSLYIAAQPYEPPSK